MATTTTQRGIPVPWYLKAAPTYGATTPQGRQYPARTQTGTGSYGGGFTAPTWGKTDVRPLPTVRTVAGRPGTTAPARPFTPPAPRPTPTTRTPPAKGTTPGTGATPARPAPPAAGATPGLSPTRGFASRYAPGMLDTIYDNPWTILPDVFKGIQTSSPGYQALRDFGGDPLSLYNIIKGSGSKIDGGSDEFTNFMADLYKNLGTPGGKGFDAKGMIDAVFGTTKTGADATSSLGQILGAGDMGQQIRTLFNLLRDVSGVGMNPLAASGYQSALAQAGDRYGLAQMKAPAGQTMTPVEWIAKNMPTLALR